MSAHTSARIPVGQPRRLYCWAAALSCSDKTAGTGQSVITLTVVSPETVRNHQKCLLFCSWSDVICTNRSWEWEHLPDNKTGTNTSRAKLKSGHRCPRLCTGRRRGNGGGQFTAPVSFTLFLSFNDYDSSTK